MVRVHHDEDVANHIGPESCVATREGWGEASTGESTGQPLSREILHVSGADAFQTAEGNMNGRANASARTARRGRRPWHVQTVLVREPGGLASDRRGCAAWPAGGRRGAVADDARAREV